MKQKMLSILFIILLSITPSWTQEVVYEELGGWDWATNVPASLGESMDRAFSKDKIVPWLWIAGTTALTLIYDREILEESQRFGRRIGLGNHDGTRTMIRFGDFSFFRGPTDVGSWLYFIGDGWTQFFLIGGFLAYGNLADNLKARVVASQLAHGLFITGAIVQTLKRTTGRESPFVSSTKTGRWDFFPNQIEYGKSTPKFDAYPSGHVATALTAVTILHNNYPEKKWLLPTGITLVSLLAFQMMNNGVHWASDYPLSIGIGIINGNIASNLGRKSKDGKKLASSRPHSLFAPFIGNDGEKGVLYHYFF